VKKVKPNQNNEYKNKKIADRLSTKNILFHNKGKYKDEFINVFIHKIPIKIKNINLIKN